MCVCVQCNILILKSQDCPKLLTFCLQCKVFYALYSLHSIVCNAFFAQHYMDCIFCTICARHTLPFMLIYANCSLHLSKTIHLYLCISMHSVLFIPVIESEILPAQCTSCVACCFNVFQWVTCCLAGCPSVIKRLNLSVHVRVFISDFRIRGNARPPP